MVQALQALTGNHCKPRHCRCNLW